MMAAMKELIIPNAAFRDENAVEMMRVWIAERGLHCTLNIGRYFGSPDASEEKGWGIILADAARHVSEAIAKRNGSAAAESLSQIREHFLGELARPTSPVKGDFGGN